MILMKKIILFFILSFIVHISVTAEINKADADSIIQVYLSDNNLDLNTNLYSYNELINQDSLQLCNKNIITTPSHSCYVYFLDEAPSANWSHKCRFLFVCNRTGNIDVIHENMPPSNWNLWSGYYEYNTGAPQIATFGSTRYKLDKETLQAENCYAVILSGGKKPSINYVRYWNDCSAIYSAITNVYGYKDENIYTLIADGTDTFPDINNQYSSPLDLDGDGDDDIMYSATKNNISIVFDELSKKLTKEDFLFIFITDHGTRINGESYICLWGENERINPTELNEEINKIDAECISIVMEQCFSGGFIPKLSRKGRIISTACSATEPSWTISKIYNDFVYHWTAAIAGYTPEGNPVNADYNGDGFVSMYEAFNYADTTGHANEHPQYSSVKPHYGEFVTMEGSNLCSNIYISNIECNTDTIFYGCDVTLKDVIINDGANVEIESMNNIILKSGVIFKNNSTINFK